MTLTERVTLLFDAARVREDRRPRYGFSNADGCSRAQVYAFREYDATGKLAPSESPARWNLAMALGTGADSLLCAAALRLGDRVQVEARLPNSYGLEIVGHCDWLTPTHVVDFKLVGDSAWRDVQKYPKAEHRTQTNAYSFALRREAWAVLYIRNVAKGEEIPFVLHEGDTSPAEAQAVIEHWREVDTHRKAGTLPDRPYAQDSFDCRNCRSRTTCWENT